MLAVWLVGAIITFFMLPYMWFNEIMGFLAVFIEAMLGKCTSTTIHIEMKTHTKKIDFQLNSFRLSCCLFFIYSGAPQFLRNFNNKSTQGMSITMVIFWTIGDMFKTGYFIFRHAPTQFWICGTLQVSNMLFV